MKLRNIMVILIINYVLIVVFCSFSELIFIGDKARNIQAMIQIAGDMALEQVQATDDFFKEGDSFQLKSTKNRLRLPSSDTKGYKEVASFETLTGKTNKKDIYSYVYGQENAKVKKFIEQNPSVLEITIPIGYWQDGFPSIQWYRIPKIAQTGLVTTGTFAQKVYDGSFEDINGKHAELALAPDVKHRMWYNYELYDAEKLSFDTVTGDYVNYYMTPLSLGITYINDELLQYFFMNNLDLLMRSKYAENGLDLNTEDGGYGVLEGTTYMDLITGDVSNANPINNGEFTLLRGQEHIDVNTNAMFYDGVKPTIRYKVIDMYDDANNEILTMIFGPVAPNNRVISTQRAEYHRISDDAYIDPATGLKVSKKPIVVAEVTFYVDAIIPYTTMVAREMRGKVKQDGTLTSRYLFDSSYVSSTDDNFLDIVRTGILSSGLYGNLGNNSNVFKYTRLFAVAP